MNPMFLLGLSSYRKPTTNTSSAFENKTKIGANQGYTVCPMLFICFLTFECRNCILLYAFCSWTPRHNTSSPSIP